MSDEKKPASPEKKMPNDATPHNPGLSPAPNDRGGETKPDDKVPYEKKPEPAQQPS